MMSRWLMVPRKILPLGAAAMATTYHLVWSRHGRGNVYTRSVARTSWSSPLGAQRLVLIPPDHATRAPLIHLGFHFSYLFGRCSSVL
uniref:Uncharacterized protein n=1 Tax=Arundo donax TaxID=35708 RepID=A0A0A9CWJ2_ARUDO